MSVAVVTGAARGFGLEIARRLIARGHEVVISDIDEPALDEAALELGSGATAVAADVRDPGEHEKLAAAAGNIGRIEVWVNNAGTAKTGKSWEQSADHVRLMVEANLLGLIYGSGVAVRMMAESGGHILNIGSMSSFGPVPGLSVYAATKAGVLNFGSSLQGDLDLAGIPIHVHTMCPDAADTKLVRDEACSEDASILFSNPKLLDPADVADRAVGLLDGKRIVHAMPAYRATLIRFVARRPRAGLRILAVLRRMGDKRRRRQMGVS